MQFTDKGGDLGKPERARRPQKRRSRHVGQPGPLGPLYPVEGLYGAVGLHFGAAPTRRANNGQDALPGPLPFKLGGILSPRGALLVALAVMCVSCSTTSRVPRNTRRV